MDFGFNIAIRGALADTHSITAFATKGEALGFTYLAIPDHIVIPTSIASPYPYSANRKMAGANLGHCMEPLAVMTYLAAITKKARLLTSVMVVPHRPALYTAKLLATIDVLSNGRVTLGVGAGWMDEEFQALGAPPFAERGKVTDEYLDAFKILWTEDNPRFEGKYVRFSNISFLPKPVQRPHLPIWVGGESPAALRRTARIGDAWYPIGTNPEFPLNTVERLNGGIAKLHQEAEKIKRDPKSIGVVYWANWYKENNLVTTDDGKRQLFTGTDANVVEDILRFKEMGMKELLFSFQRATLEESIAAMERFASEIMPKVR
ncbi:MAG: LLM class F420-dependent oxidoreductase [Betaproteobacteria bacterium]|nr:LLM class F420-dependent oxidoreductase [Betaproteobacteria bacterium]